MPLPNVDSVSARELDQLMQEFPDWKHEFPELDKELNPIRYSKNKLYLKDQKTDFLPRRPNSKFPKSAYRTTFKQHNIRPRSSKRPVKTPPRHTGLPKMTFATVQRDEFIHRQLDERTKPIIMKENYERSSDALDLTTKYQEDYRQKELPRAECEPLPYLVPRSKLRLSSPGDFDSRTTTKEHYRKWPPQRTLTFGELPSFTGSILYPGQSFEAETTTGTTFRGVRGRRAKPFIPTTGNIKIEGEMQMETTHNDVFVPFDGAQPAKKIVNLSQLGEKKRSKFLADTQSKSDFPGYAKGQPRPPKPASPAPDTIDIKFDNLRSFETEQRKQFPGIDTVQFPMQKSMKKDADEYRQPTTKFETDTCQKLDYQPIDLKTAYQPPTAVIARRSTDSLPKFDDSTTSKECFPRWNVPRRQRYGDFHEAHSYIPPVGKFEAVTTNQDTFYAKSVEMRPSFKPQEQRMSTDDERQFSTVHDDTYQGYPAAARLSKTQALVLLKALRKRKRQLEQAAQNGAENQVNHVTSPRAIAAK